jgi:AcrR family transcriptional regulator
VTAASPVLRPLRRDAALNRSRIVASARELFAAAGSDVSVEEITRHAGVGMGTLYRHFATKEQLIEAVLEDAYAEFAGAAERALQHPDAWAGFCDFMEQALALHVANRALKDVLGGRDHDRPQTRAMRARMRPLMQRLIDRAQQQGSLRDDFRLEDMPLLFWTSHSVIEATAAVAPELWRRHLGLLLDGLRAQAATPLVVPPLTRAQLARTRRRRAG